MKIIRENIEFKQGGNPYNSLKVGQTYRIKIITNKDGTIYNFLEKEYIKQNTKKYPRDELTLNISAMLTSPTHVKGILLGNKLIGAFDLDEVLDTALPMRLVDNINLYSYYFISEYRSPEILRIFLDVLKIENKLPIIKSVLNYNTNENIMFKMAGFKKIKNTGLNYKTSDIWVYE